MKRLIEKGQPAVEAEQNVLGTDHAEVGAALAYRWHLPDFIVEAIGLHHKPPLPPRLSALAYLADRIAHESETFGETRETPKEEREFEIFEAMGFSAAGWQGLIEQVLEASVKTEELVAATC
jgi:HD-like signal output (HDOD) protein